MEDKERLISMIKSYRVQNDETSFAQMCGVHFVDFDVSFEMEIQLTQFGQIIVL